MDFCRNPRGMLSKSSINLSSRTFENLGLQINNIQSMVSAFPTHITINLKTTSEKYTRKEG
jgi:hypothetical protein